MKPTSMFYDSTLLGQIVNGITPAAFKASGISIDSRTLQAGELYIAIKGEQQDGHRFVPQARERGAVAALVSVVQDDPLPQMVVKDTTLALGQLAQGWRLQQPNLTVIAVTGSNGKTSVKEMLRPIFATQGEVLATAGNFNNHIGLPLTLLQLQPQHRYAILEMGANHPGEIAYLAGLAKPDIALVNNVGPAHLQGFGSIEGVAAAKAEIYQALSAAGVAVINADDAFAGLMRQVAAQVPARVIGFGCQAAAEVGLDTTVPQSPQVLHLKTPQGTQQVHLPLLGQHNVMNALAASAVAVAANIGLADIKTGLEAMQAVPGRLQLRQCTVKGLLVRVIDDTYNANLASLTAALKVLAEFPGHKWVALGAMGELGEQGIALHQQAGQRIKASGVSQLFAVGELCRESVAALGENGHYFSSQAELIVAVQAALQELAQGGGTAEMMLLVKGSRSMQMEQVVQAILAIGEGKAPC